MTCAVTLGHSHACPCHAVAQVAVADVSRQEAANQARKLSSQVRELRRQTEEERELREIERSKVEHTEDLLKQEVRGCVLGLAGGRAGVCVCACVV